MTDLRRRLAVISVLAAMAAAVLDASSMNMALPSISHSLQIKPSDAAWLIITYQAALMASLLPFAAIGDRFGERRTFICGVFLFGASALACMLMDNFVFLIVMRMFQGIGAAAIMALGIALARQAVPPGDFGRVIGWNAMTVALMSAAGPTIGAALLSFGSWRFVFSGGIALAVISLGAAFALPLRNIRGELLDIRGIVSFAGIVITLALAAALVRIMPGLSVILASAGTLGLWLLVRRDYRRLVPFLPLDLLGNPVFRRSAIASVACFSGLSGTLLILPFALHTRLGADPLEIALLLTPWPLAVLLTTPVTSRLLAHYEAAKICISGGICMAVGLSILAMAASSAELHVLAVVLIGIGFGLFQTPNNRSLFLAAPLARAAAAGGLQATARLTGQVTGAFVASLLLSMLTILSASRYGFGLAGLATLISALTSGLRLTDRSGYRVFR